MKVNVTRSQLLQLLTGLDLVKGLSGIKLGYACGRNKKAIQEEFEIFNKTLDPSEEFNKYDEERKKLCLEHCSYDDNNMPIIENNVYVGLDDNKKFQKAFEALKKKNQKLLDEQQKKVDEYNKVLAEEKIDFNLWVVSLDELPQGITVEQMDAIFLMIVDEKK